MRTLEVSLWFDPNIYFGYFKKIEARTAKPSNNLRNQRLLGSQKYNLQKSYRETANARR